MSRPQIAKPAAARAANETQALRDRVEHQRRELEACGAVIDELRQHLARATAAAAARAELFAETSHELRTPINAIIGFAEIIRSESLGPLGNPIYRDYLDDILFCGRHLFDLIGDTLDLVRHDAGRMTLKEEPAPLGAIIEEAVRLMAPQAMRAEVALGWCHPAAEELPWLRCDRRRVRQILLNLLSNAVKFTEPGGRVEIRVAGAPDPTIVITDTGIGIEPATIPLGFAHHGRVEPGLIPHRGGSGLGLSLARALTEQHGGSLTLESSPAGGTTARVSLPRGRIVAPIPDTRAAANAGSASTLQG